MSVGVLLQFRTVMTNLHFCTSAMRRFFLLASLLHQIGMHLLGGSPLLA